MATFPRLKTDAVSQYPSGREVRFANEVLRFVDGAEQRYRNFASGLRRWAIRLELLDEGEMAALEQFFVENQGAFGSFAFTDPWDGTQYSDCSLESDELAAVFEGEMRSGTQLTVRENRS